MTIEERLDRIEHITAGIDEQRRKDNEENRQLWRDTQRQINEISVKIVQLGDEIREVDQRLGKRIDQLAVESRAADQRLGDRIESLVSAMGDFIQKMRRPDAN